MMWRSSHQLPPASHKFLPETVDKGTGGFTTVQVFDSQVRDTLEQPAKEGAQHQELELELKDMILHPGEL
jgi:hypothetical protein